MFYCISINKKGNVTFILDCNPVLFDHRGDFSRLVSRKYAIRNTRQIYELFLIFQIQCTFKRKFLPLTYR